MPWVTPTLEQLRTLNKGYITGQLHSVPMIPNSVLRVMSDANSGLAYLTLLYINWVALQLLPDTAEQEWLDRHADIWLVNDDGTKGRKLANFASGTATATGLPNVTLPSGTQLNSVVDSSGDVFNFQTAQAVILSATPTPVAVVATTPGAGGNLPAGASLSLTTAVSGSDPALIVVSLTGGTDQETDTELRTRVLERIQQPPMGGDAEDYVDWALRVPGVTRVWVSPLEMGIGTVTVRFMMDDLRANTNPLLDGFPTQTDISAVSAFLTIMRPVTAKDIFVEGPIPFPINCTISNLQGTAQPAAIVESIQEMLAQKAKPAFTVNGIAQPPQTIYSAWVSDAILNTQGVISFDLTMTDQIMPNNGSMAVIGTVTFQ